jgi:hypothetical protein
MITPIPEPALLDLQTRASEPGMHLYVILDGARDDRVYPNVMLCGLRHTCLYRGELPEVLAAAAPHLVELEMGVAFTKWLLKFGWGQSWGIFFTSTAHIEDLQRHFRRFLKVRSEQGQRLYFRYYDPRVLRAYLPTCNREERDFVFGPVNQFLVESEDGKGLLAFSNDAFALKLETTLQLA